MPRPSDEGAVGAMVPTPPSAALTNTNKGSRAPTPTGSTSSSVAAQEDARVRARGGLISTSGGGGAVGGRAIGGKKKQSGMATSMANDEDELNREPQMMTTADTLLAGKVYLNEHPRRGGPSAGHLSSLVSGNVPPQKGAFASTSPSTHNASKQRLLASTTALGNGGVATLTTTSTAIAHTLTSPLESMSGLAPPPLAAVLPASGRQRVPEEGHNSGDILYNNSSHYVPSQIVFGAEVPVDNSPSSQHYLASPTVPIASVSCNVDHDDNMVKKLVLAYAQRQVAKANGGGGNAGNKKTGRAATALVEQQPQTAVDDLFMRSVMSVTKLPEAMLGGLGSGASTGLGGGINGTVAGTSARVRPSVLVPTKIPIHHWVLRETLYDTVHKPRNQQKGRVDASVFTDLRQHKRSVVFPSQAPGNRPEVYYLAQTLDLMFAGIPDGYGTLASGEECYRILEAPTVAQVQGSGDGADPSVERALQQQQHDFPATSTSYYKAALALWDVLDAGFTEISRQVSPQCTERAALLEALRTVAKDVGTTGLEVMQFCKEEVRSLLEREAELMGQLEERDQTIADLRAEVARLREQQDACASDLADYDGLKARYDAIKQQVHIGTAMLVRDRRLADVLAAIDANDTNYLSEVRASSSSAAAGGGSPTHGPNDLAANPHLALLASGVSGIDLEAVKQLVMELNAEEQQKGGTVTNTNTNTTAGGPIARNGGGGAMTGLAAANNGCGSGGLPSSSLVLAAGPSSETPETYHEAIKYLLTLDEAVKAIDVACLPFYQRALFDNPALCVSVASGKWRAIAKAIGRHEMILEQRERQWREAVKQLAKEERVAAVGSDIDISSKSALLTQAMNGGGSGNASSSQHLLSANFSGSGDFGAANTTASMLHEGSVMEQQMAFMHKFRSTTRRLLGAAFGIGKRRGQQQNPDGSVDDGIDLMGDDEDEEDANSSPSAKRQQHNRRQQRGLISPTTAASNPQQPSSPDAVAKANAEAFLNAKLMLPASYSMGKEGIATMLKDTRAVMVEIVQRLCALATSAQLKELSKPPMLPPTDPSEPCPLCSRIHVAELQRRRRDEAMARIVEEAETREKTLTEQINAIKGELEDANNRIARSLRQAKDSQTRTATLEKQLAQQAKELQVLRDWGGAAGGGGSRGSVQRGSISSPRTPGGGNKSEDGSSYYDGEEGEDEDLDDDEAEDRKGMSAVMNFSMSESTRKKHLLNTDGTTGGIEVKSRRRAGGRRRSQRQPQTVSELGELVEEIEETVERGPTTRRSRNVSSGGGHGYGSSSPSRSPQRSNHHSKSPAAASPLMPPPSSPQTSSSIRIKGKAGGNNGGSGSDPIVVELVINCSCCNGGTAASASASTSPAGSPLAYAADQRNALLLKSQQLTAAAGGYGGIGGGGGSATPGKGSSHHHGNANAKAGGALARLMAGYGSTATAAAIYGTGVVSTSAGGVPPSSNTDGGGGGSSPLSASLSSAAAAQQWASGGSKVAGLPSNPAELLQALANGADISALAATANAKNGGKKGALGRASSFLTPAPPSSSGGGGGINAFRNTVSIRQTQAALGIKKKQSFTNGSTTTTNNGGRSATPSTAGGGGIGSSNGAELPDGRVGSAPTAILVDGVDDLPDGYNPHKQQQQQGSQPRSSHHPTDSPSSPPPRPEDPVVEGVSDLGLYNARDEERAQHRLKAGQAQKVKAFWGYIGRVIGADGDIGGTKTEGDAPEVFPTNPQYANVKSRLHTYTRSGAGGLGTTAGGKKNPHRHGYAPLLAGGHDPAKAGIYYPRFPSKSSAVVLSNLLTAEENAQGIGQLRGALGIDSGSDADTTLSAAYASRAPKSLGWLLKFMTQFYKSKLFADLVTMHHRPRIAKDGAGLAAPIAYLQTMLRNMYGHKNVIRSTLQEVALACASYCSVDPRVAQFVRFLTDTTTLPAPNSSSAGGQSSDDDGDGGTITTAPVSEASRSLFFFSRLSRAVDNCTVGLNYATSTAAFCHDDEQTLLQVVSLARLQGVLQQTQLIKKPYSSALWDVVCSAAVLESPEVFRATQQRNGFILLQDELHPRDWSADDVKRARMTCPKIVFLVAATQFEAILREQMVVGDDEEDAGVDGNTATKDPDVVNSNAVDSQ